MRGRWITIMLMGEKWDNLQDSNEASGPFVGSFGMIIYFLQKSLYCVCVCKYKGIYTDIYRYIIYLHICIYSLESGYFGQYL